MSGSKRLATTTQRNYARDLMYCLEFDDRTVTMLHQQHLKAAQVDVPNGESIDTVLDGLTIHQADALIESLKDALEEEE